MAEERKRGSCRPERQQVTLEHLREEARLLQFCVSDSSRSRRRDVLEAHVHPKVTREAVARETLSQPFATLRTVTKETGGYRNTVREKAARARREFARPK